MLLISAAGALGGVGFCFGIGLAIANKLLLVELNKKEQAIVDALPGINCGACGFPGCSRYAAKLVEGNTEPNRCLPGGEEVAAAIGEILNIKVEMGPKQVARLLCRGGGRKAGRKFDYQGAMDCQMAVLVGEGDKNCRFACLGLGTCVRVCDFGAITIDEESGLPVVDEEKCMACGACIRECPKRLFELCNASKRVNILCSSNAVKGAEVRKVCSIGCIKCKKCIKVCDFDAPHFVDNMVKIDTEKCTNCGDCVRSCPVKIINMIEENKENDNRE